MKIVNATPHEVKVVAADGTTVIFAASGILPRVETKMSAVTPLECEGKHFQVAHRTQGEVTGLPAADGETVYIVSAMVLSALKVVRQDVVAPDTGPTAIRENGQIVAVRGFVVEV